MWLKDDGTPMAFFDAVPGGKSVGVPGTPPLLERLHRATAACPGRPLIAPTIRLAEEGFPSRPASPPRSPRPRPRPLRADPQLLLRRGRQPEGRGHDPRNPDLARDPALIAAHGAATVLHRRHRRRHRGGRARPVKLRHPDLEDSPLPGGRARRPSACPTAPRCLRHGPAESGGLTVGQILGMLAGFDLPGMGDDRAAWHLFAEASKLAFADRGLYMADADFVDMPETLLDPDYLATRAELIDPGRGDGEGRTRRAALRRTRTARPRPPGRAPGHQPFRHRRPPRRHGLGHDDDRDAASARG
jgi:gamma-glutamyltranspeptidase / glutathione hydrolase